jgi:hypothetical protein
MRFHTHDRTQKAQSKKSVKIILAFGFGLTIAFFLLIAVVCSLYINSIMPAVLILSPLTVLVILIAITQRDMDKAYVEIVDDVIIAVDYYFGIKKEKTFSIRDIAAAETLTGYSMRVRGYRYSNAGITYIVFRDKSGKYMFKVICVPETKQFFGRYFK